MISHRKAMNYEVTLLGSLCSYEIDFRKKSYRQSRRYKSHLANSMPRTCGWLHRFGIRLRLHPANTSRLRSFQHELHRFGSSNRAVLEWIDEDNTRPVLNCTSMLVWRKLQSNQRLSLSNSIAYVKPNLLPNYSVKFAFQFRDLLGTASTRTNLQNLLPYWLISQTIHGDCCWPEILLFLFQLIFSF